MNLWTNILKVMNLNSDSLQIQVASPALEERRLTVNFLDESSEVVATLIASALGLQCAQQGVYSFVIRIKLINLRK